MSVMLERGPEESGLGETGFDEERSRAGTRAGRAPVRRVRAGETRRPPTRARVVAGHRARGAAPCSPPAASPRWPWLVVLAVAVGAGLVALGAFVSALAGGSAAPVPERTAVVSVLPGDTLEAFASRFAPGSDVSAVVERIQELNDLSGGALSAGMPLVVPVQACDRAPCGGG